MAWSRLTAKDLELKLAEDELEKLATCSIDDSRVSTILQDQLDIVSDAYRGAWQTKGYTIDVRDHYTAPEYKEFILNYARYSIFTRFPMAENYALSEPRKKQYEEAAAMLKNPYLGTSKPDYSDDPELSGDTSLTSTQDAAISMPWQRFPAEPFQEGFYKVWPWTRTWW